MPRLVGDRVVLREYRSDDFASLRAWVTDAEASRHLTGIFDPPHTEEMTRAFLESVLQRSNRDMYHFIIARVEDESYLGQIDLRIKDRVAGRADFGVIIPERANRGKGFGTEAIRLLVDFAFSRLNLHRVELEVFADNDHAIRVYEQLGFRHEGRHRDYFYRDGAYQDAVSMAMVRE